MNLKLEGFLFWLGIFLSTTLLPMASAFLAAAHCVQFGQGNTNLCFVGFYNSPIRAGSYTIGTRKFDIKYTFHDFGFQHQPSIDKNKQICDPAHKSGYAIPSTAFIHACVGENIVKMQIHAVKQDGVVMAGWLHVSIQLVDPSDEILAIYIQMRDEYFNAIGEFITEEDEQCGTDNQKLAQPSKYQVLPCSAVGLREAEVATALFMVQPSILTDRAAGEKFLSNVSVSRGVHFTWRMSEYWCNRKLRIRPE